MKFIPFSEKFPPLHSTQPPKFLRVPGRCGVATTSEAGEGQFSGCALSGSRRVLSCEILGHLNSSTTLRYLRHPPLRRRYSYT